MSIYRTFGKRLFDVLGSAALLVALSPVFVVAAALVRFLLGAPVLFRQTRPGLNGTPFAICKFRTMTDARDDRGELLPDSVRLTRFGMFLRASSLDELPELLNVLRGEMSLVGPRPLLMKYQPFYSPDERKRFEVRPGITGWAQINGRNAARWDDRLGLDVWYAEHVSFSLDLRILFRTLVQTLRREGVVVDPRSTMLDLDVERSRSVSSDRLPTC